ncbi:unnamed protein product [Leuciscus chuanchicus]
MMERKYDVEFQQTKDALSCSSMICLTTDVWTSMATEAYLGLTCHFINDEWELMIFNLTTMPLEERHKAKKVMGSLPSAALVTLQLIVNHALKKNTHIQKAIGAARSLVEHFD